MSKRRNQIRSVIQPPQNTSTSAINLVSMCIVIISEVISKNDQNNTRHATIRRTIHNAKHIHASVLLKIYPPLFLLEVTAYPTTTHSRPHPASASVQHIHRQKIRKERNEDEWHDRIEYLGWRIPADRTKRIQRQYRCDQHTDDRFHGLDSRSDS